MVQEFQLKSLTVPNAEEKLTASTLVVGGTLAAYTATLAALRAGEKVCWVTPEPPGALLRMDPQWLELAANSLAARRGHRHQLPGTHFAMSLSQRQWREAVQSVQAALVKPSMTSVVEKAAASPVAAPAIRGIQTYLQNQQLIVVPNARPLWVLYKENRGRRRITQVVFRLLSKPQRFFVQAGVAIDATSDGVLNRLVQQKAGVLAAELSASLVTQDLVSTGSSGQARGRCFDDSVGLGAGIVRKISPWAKPQAPPILPFTLSGAALVSAYTEGLLIAGPMAVEPERGAIAPLAQSPTVAWALGEAAGLLAAFTHREQIRPQDLLVQPVQLKRFQLNLVRSGVPLFWFDDIAQDDPDFEAIQMLAVADVLRSTSRRDLHFRPNLPVSRAVLATALVRLERATPGAPASPKDAQASVPLKDLPLQHWAYPFIQTAIRQGWMLPLQPQLFKPSRVVTHRQLHTVLERVDADEPLRAHQTTAYQDISSGDNLVRRRHLARVLYRLYRQRLGI